MDTAALRELLQSVRDGRATPEDALARLREFPFAQLGFATVDTHRALRQGYPEVVMGAGKTAEQIAAIVATLARGGGNLLVTRVDADKAAAVRALAPELAHDAVARALVLEQRPPGDLGRGPIGVVTAGTSDIPVAEEAALTARLYGNRVERVYDVGVAGLHRVLHRRDALVACTALVVVAGMEGALASVVAGLVGRPVVAVPTSVGYGASFGGLAALLGMLNSCATGVAVVNIDNGFGAGAFAALLNRREPVGMEIAPPGGGAGGAEPAR